MKYKTPEEEREAIAVLEACDTFLNSPSINDRFIEESYKVASSIRNAGNSLICQHCKYLRNGKCPLTMTERVKKQTCIRAKGIKILKENGLYGQEYTKHRKS